MALNWKSTLDALDSSPNIGTPNGQAVLKSLLEAGNAYASAGSFDTVLIESEQHRQWASRPPSQRLGETEPTFYVAAYYAVPRGRIDFQPLTPDQLPTAARGAYGYWAKLVSLPGIAAETVAIGKIFLRNLIGIETAKAREAAERARPPAPTLGRIQNELVSALAAAQAFLAA